MSKIQQASIATNGGDQLRDWLSQAEDLMPSARQRDDVALLLSTLDDAHGLDQALIAAGQDTRGEQNRMQSVTSRLQSHSAHWVRMAGGVRGFAELRTQQQGDASLAWWSLDARVLRARKATIRGLLTAAGVCAVMLGLGYIFRDVLFPPNPVRDAISAAEQAVEREDRPAAIAAIEAGLLISPTNLDLNLWRGVLAERSGDPAIARERFAIASAGRQPRDVAVQRGQIYFRLEETARGLADMEAAIAQTPDAPELYYIRALGWEQAQRNETALGNTAASRENYRKAIADLEKTATLAEAQRQDVMVASARVRLAMLLQQAGP